MNKCNIGVLAFKIFGLFLLVEGLIQMLGQIPALIYPVVISGYAFSMIFQWLGLTLLLCLCPAILIGSGWYLMRHGQVLALRLFPESSAERRILRVSLSEVQAVAFSAKIFGIYLLFESLMMIIGQIFIFYSMLPVKSSRQSQWLDFTLLFSPSLLCLAIMIGSGWYLIRHSQGIVLRLLLDASTERRILRVSLSDVLAIGFSAVGLYLVALYLPSFMANIFSNIAMLIILHDHPPGLFNVVYNLIYTILQLALWLLLFFKSHALVQFWYKDRATAPHPKINERGDSPTFP